MVFRGGSCWWRVCSGGLLPLVMYRSVPSRRNTLMSWMASWIWALTSCGFPTGRWVNASTIRSVCSPVVDAQALRGWPRRYSSRGARSGGSGTRRW